MELAHPASEGLLRRPWDRLQILTAAQTHLLHCSLGRRPLRASFRVRASHLHLWRSPSFAAYPTVSSVRGLTALTHQLTGNFTVNLAPFPGSLSHQTWPFMDSTMRLTIDKPRPVELSPPVGLALKRANFPNNFF